MNWELNAEQLRLRQAALELGRMWAPRRVELRNHTYRTGAHHPEFWDSLRVAGFLGMLVPSTFGGTSGGVLRAAVVLEGLAEGGVPTPFPVLTHAVTRAVDRAGPPTLRQRVLPEVAAGRCLFALVFTEQDAGHNYLAMRTTVRRRADDYVVEGTKTYISGVDLADRLFVVGRADAAGDAEPGGVPPLELAARQRPTFTGVLVDPRASGVATKEIDMAGREGVRQWQVTFTDVRVGPGDLVGAHGGADSYLFEMFNVERLLYSALMVGVAAYWLSQAVAFARSRIVFADRAIYDYQAIQHPFARLHAHLHAARLATFRAAALFDADAAAAPGEVNIAKFLAAEVAHDVTDQALQAYGGRGFDQQLGLLQDHLDTRLFRSGPVSQELTLNYVATHVL